MIGLVLFLLAFTLLLLFLLLRERTLRRKKIQQILNQMEAFEKEGTPYEPTPSEDDWAQLEQALSHLTQHTALLQDQSKKASRQTERLIADVAHQWKTPLASLKLYCELSLEAKEDARERKKLALIERMEAMIEALLRLEKLRSGSYEMQFQQLDILALTTDICQELSLLYPQKQFIFPQESLLLRADPYWLREALVNVIKNACQHTPEGGNICIRWKTSECSDWILIEDNGGGVPSDALEHLFDRFYRTGSQGAGLGLPIARAICQSHHGNMSAENTVEGLRISILLPRLSSTLRQSAD